MLSERVSQFLRDERGSYTIWSLIWFLMYVALGGIAVDMTDAFQKEHLLQAAADAAALGSVMSLGQPGQDPVPVAKHIAKMNMDQDIHGTVLTADDVEIGTWVFSQERFYIDTEEPNAVYVTTRRAEKNHNPVAMNLLRVVSLLGIPTWWNINTEAVAVKGTSICHNQGLIAGGRLVMAAQDKFYNNICLHGTTEFVAAAQNTFDTGVSISTTCSDCIGPGGRPLSNTESLNPGFGDAYDLGGPESPVGPWNAQHVGEYIEKLKTRPNAGTYDTMVESYGDNYKGWEYLYHPDGTAPTPRPVSSLPSTLEPYSVYEVSCTGEQIELPASEITNVAIVSDCRVHGSDGMVIRDAVIAVDPKDETNHGLHFAANATLGDTDCKKGGGVEIYVRNSDIHFAGQGSFGNVRILAEGDVQFAALNGSHRHGIHVEAMGDITMPALNEWGLCENNYVNGPVQWTYSLVR